MPRNRIAIFENYNAGGYEDLGAHRVIGQAPRAKKAHRKRAHSSPAQKRQQAKLKHCVKECKRNGPFRPCMSTCLRKQK
ncbi:MAG: hypothetical protein Q8R92_07800 [Deltaproteobacteria bacterium]|nr:hypothetical protein [Deltaproteobacteria bacterium]